MSMETLYDEAKQLTTRLTELREENKRLKEQLEQVRKSVLLHEALISIYEKQEE